MNISSHNTFHIVRQSVHKDFDQRVDNLFDDMRRKLEREATYIETLMELTGAVDVVLTSANNKQHEGSSQPPVEHRVCSLPVS